MSSPTTSSATADGRAWQRGREQGENLPELQLQLSVHTDEHEHPVIGRTGIRTHGLMAILLGVAHATHHRGAVLAELARAVTRVGMEETAKAIVALHRAAPLRGHIGRFAWPALLETWVRSRLGSCNEWPMTRYFPGLVDALKAILPKRYVVDGEIVIVKGDRLGFEALRVQCDVNQADEGSGGRLALPPFEIWLDRAIVKRRPCHLPGPLQWGLARR